MKDACAKGTMASAISNSNHVCRFNALNENRLEFSGWIYWVVCCSGNASAKSFVSAISRTSC